MPRIYGYISRKTIKAWLEDYQSLEAGDRPLDAMPSNSGTKPEDGVTATRINKIMLDQAIGQLPGNLKAVVKWRWVDRKPLGEAMRALCYRDKKAYYSACDKAVKEIYNLVNGRAVGYNNLFKKIVENA